MAIQLLTPYLHAFVEEARELDRRRLLANFRPNFTPITNDRKSSTSGRSDRSIMPPSPVRWSSLRLFWMRGEKFYMERVYDAAAAHLARHGSCRDAGRLAGMVAAQRGRRFLLFTTRRPDRGETTLTNRRPPASRRPPS